MQAYEFHTTAQNGFIKIPDEYVKKIGPEIRVILFSDENPDLGTPPARSSLMELAGALKGCDDMDIKEIRAERRQKYENPD